jgi:hypothetical protein
MSNENKERKNIWYKAVSTKDYEKITQMGQAVIQVRILPGITEQNTLYEAFYEKDVSRSPYPNTQKWLVPVLVINDCLHPEKNGFVGVMEITKTLAKQIRGTSTPPNYFDFQNGFNFNIVVSMRQSKDGNSFFPDYGKSAFDQSPSPVSAQYVVPKMKEQDFADFAAFVQRLNNPKPKTNNQTYIPTQQPAPQPNTYAPQAPVQPNVPQPSVPVQQQNSGVLWQVAETPPQPEKTAQTQEISNEDFDSIFGTPGNDVPF